MLALVFAPLGVAPASAAHRRQLREGDRVTRLTKSKDEWRQHLSPRAYRVLFEEDTEPPFTSPLNGEKRPGTYICAACYLPLFSSKTKFDSRTGWPSFYQPLRGRVDTKRDFTALTERTEYHCKRCGGHQGHVFDDGPLPTRQRWCNNGVALEFVLEGEPLPPLIT
jgi:peptide-methionine (R)-S-oxide reductase